MLVLAVDTGLGVGYAMYETNTGAFTSWEHDVVDTAMMNVDVVIIEKYVQRSGVLTNQPDALKQNGQIERFCKERGIKLVQQMPADAKRFSKDDKMKALGWYKRTKDMHSTDAARHLLRFLVKNQLLFVDDKRKLIELARR